VLGLVAGTGLNIELAFIGGIMGHILFSLLQGQLGLIPLLTMDFRGELLVGKSLGFNLGAAYSIIHCSILFFHVVDVAEVGCVVFYTHTLHLLISGEFISGSSK